MATLFLVPLIFIIPILIIIAVGAGIILIMKILYNGIPNPRQSRCRSLLASLVYWIGIIGAGAIFIFCSMKNTSTANININLNILFFPAIIFIVIYLFAAYVCWRPKALYE